MVPKIRFKSFSASLGEHKIEDILARFVSPVSVSKIEKYREIGIRSHGRGLFHKEEVSGAELGDKRVFWIKKDAVIFNIVFAWEQAVAITSSKDEGCIASHRFPMYLPKDNKCNTDYIRRYFLTKKGKYLLEFASPGGAGRNKTLGQKNFDELVVTIPDVTEQTKIADFLSSVDEKITLLKNQYDLLCQYKKGMMQKIFSQKVRFKDESGEEFPEWQIMKLGEVAQIKRGASPRPITDPIWFDSLSNIGWVRISDVTKSNKYLLKTEQYVSDKGVKKSRLVNSEKIIMSICATIGKPICTTFDVCIHDGFVVFESLSTNTDFLYYYLSFIEDNWQRYGQPGTQVNLNVDIVSNESINIPSLSEQIKISQFLANIDNKLTSKKAELDKLKTWKQGLLQQMFV
ncbi:restriction endonuclease subunit S [Klebsiella pneumoniae]|uniref:restriction endonuclease subunit S n=1 Tax=Klebsiella pneumoniae TaxID=573 RepID=UPI000930E6FB|nr:restriction endonuclease subunit S [Klebsiella pneumoniae]AWA61290.1 restriction endonuclease subunit S [Klebsiella pneumoniae]AXU01054.1 restriction endonuclease subunit S [Klebsiella pneumoniae]QBP79979.1 restriction endonuclease subunit S [Klebsiella pneumoniae]